MADTSSRMLQLLSLLQLHRYWHGPELAERLGVSLRTLRRDIDRLRGLGYPIESVRGVDGGYQLATGPSLAPLAFTHDEAVALAIGLRDVAHGSDPATAEASLRALAKLVTTLPEAVRRQVQLIEHVTESIDPMHFAVQPASHVLGTVAQACRDQVRLRFGYENRQSPHSAESAKPATEPIASRYVEPYRLVTRGRRWYLVAFDLDRVDWRTFRVDRMSEPSPTRNSFSARELPANDLSAYVADRIRELRPSHHVEFVAHAPESETRRVVGASATFTPLSARRTRVAMTVDDLDWPMLIICKLATPVTVTSANLVTHLAQRGKMLGAVRTGRGMQMLKV